MGSPLTDSNFKQTCSDWVNDVNKQSIIDTFGSIEDWDTSQVTDMSEAFYFSDERTIDFNDDISKWDTSSVTDMRAMFKNCIKFNQNLSAKLVTKNGSTYLAWDTSKVKNMSYMFLISDSNNSGGYFNNGQDFDVNNLEGTQPLYWDTSSLENMEMMFSRQRRFNQKISTDCIVLKNDTTTRIFYVWDTFKVTNMQSLFVDCESFNNGELPGESTQPLNWNTKEVTSMYYMFGIYRRLVTKERIFELKINDVKIKSSVYGCYNQPMVSKEITIDKKTYVTWDLSKCKILDSMFNAQSLFNQDISSWNVSSVTNMEWMFNSCWSFNQDISSWNVSRVANMDSMFNYCFSFNQDISDWNVSAVTNMSYMLNRCFSFNQNLSNWERKDGVNGATSTSTLKNVSTMFAMFSETSFNHDISNWDVSNVIKMNSMFGGGDYNDLLEPYTWIVPFNQDISKWNMKNVTNAYTMFYYSKMNQDLSKLELNNDVDVTQMFKNSEDSYHEVDSEGTPTLIQFGPVKRLKLNFNTEILNKSNELDLSRTLIKININGTFKNILDVVDGDTIKDINDNDIKASIISQVLKTEFIIIKNNLTNRFKKELVNINLNNKIDFLVDKYYIMDSTGEYVEIKKDLLVGKTFVGSNEISYFKSLESVENKFLKTETKYIGDTSGNLVSDDNFIEQKVFKETLTINLVY